MLAKIVHTLIGDNDLIVGGEDAFNMVGNGAFLDASIIKQHFLQQIILKNNRLTMATLLAQHVPVVEVLVVSLILCHCF